MRIDVNVLALLCYMAGSVLFLAGSVILLIDRLGTR